MNRLFIFIGLLMTIHSETFKSQDSNNLVAIGAQLEILGDGFSFTEGPAADTEGNVYFTDQPNDKIYKWSLDGELSVFLDKTGRANGMYFDYDGNLISCSDMDNELWKIGMNGERNILVTNYRGKKLNGPNDVWVRPDGGMYFTDPLYVRDYWVRNPEMEQEGEFVYYLSSDKKTLIPVDTELVKPNGIVGTPDGKSLYVADIRGGKTYLYTIQEDGSLTDKRLFVTMGSDGMTIDEEGNLYITGHGVTVFNPQGELILHIPIDVKWTANICFGGKDKQTLFITASQKVFGLRMRVKGVR